MLKAIYSTFSCILFLSQICAMNQNIGASGTQQNSQQWKTFTDLDFVKEARILSGAGIEYEIWPLNPRAYMNPNKNEVTSRKDSTEKIAILISNTHSCTIEAYEKTCYTRGVSSHILITYTGKVLLLVPFGYMTFMAGSSGYFNMSSLNQWSINIQVLGGAYYDKEKDKKIEEYLRNTKLANGQTIIIKDGIELFQFTDAQHKSLGILIQILKKEFDIKYTAGLCDVNYKHVAPVFCLDWKKLFDDYKVGFYPNKETVEKVATAIESLPTSPNEDVIDSLLKLCGYDIKHNLEATLEQRIWHFCARYQQEVFTEEKFEYSKLSIEQKNTILAALLVTARHYVATLNLISDEGFSGELGKIALAAPNIYRWLIEK